ncbi:MAG: BamA/TamA family outer membrane protein [Calditrichaceae bacterium]|nr:BamA/TamA family outer membrane protein [Calditrichaceae bacterium]MBN2709146.1 BamA/TamA family outer membrane protein [Calditrichaceae bacterium]RQV96102.1 MAG: hypothetical protein EH224_05195 [Calditrichota bacterium]
MTAASIKYFIRVLIFFIALSAELNAQSEDTLPVEIDKIIYDGDFDTHEKEINRAIAIKSGQKILPARLPEIADRIRRYSLEQGYLYALIDSIRLEDAEKEGLKNLHIRGKLGGKVFIGQYRIKADSLPPDELEPVIFLQKGQVFSQQHIEKQVTDILEYLSDKGYLFAEARIDSFKITKDEDQLQAGFIIALNALQKIRLRDVILTGNYHTKDDVILREIGIQSGEICTSEKIEKIPARLMRLGIFKEVSRPEILWKSGADIQLKLAVVEGNSTTLDGVVGYIPRQNEDGYFVGRIDLSFNNPFGANRRLDIFWEKPDELSEEFHLSYTEPWLFKYPVSLSLGLDRIVRDTTYVEWNLTAESRIRLFGDFSAIGGFSRKSAFPDSAASRDMRLLRNAALNLFAGIEMDNRDNPINPRKGVYSRLDFSYGFKTNYGPSYLLVEEQAAAKESIQTYDIKFYWFYHLWANQILALQVNGWQTEGGRLQLTDFKWFGGYQSVRGYRDKQFQSDRIAWVNTEYRFLTGLNSRMFIFCDTGYYRRHESGLISDEWLMGYGAGVRLETGLGILGVDYGLARGDTFSDGKIHFGIVSRF